MFIAFGVCLLLIGLVFITVAFLSQKNKNDTVLQKAKKTELELRNEIFLLINCLSKKSDALEESYKSQLKTVTQFAQLGKLTSEILHDLANPLALVTLNLEQLENLKLSSIGTSLNRAKKGAFVMQKYIESARKQMQNHEEKELFVIGDVIREVVELYQPKLSKHKIKLHYYEDSPITAYGSPTKLHHVLSNLISNAVEALINKSAESPAINVYVERKKDDKKTSEYYIEIKVTDNGEGIPTKTLERVFDPFFSTKKTKTKLGIGLYLTKEIIETSFQGKISVGVNSSKETVFTIQIPHKF
ncbi:MAG: periplasmic sensor signal transduction histidine kinase [uncultured bacterium]|nr:MAG: periplasmic sensor signal transduction histidine kinase [uncultured bacterium]